VIPIVKPVNSNTNLRKTATKCAVNETAGQRTTMTKVTTFTATIYVGFREQYTDEIRAIDMAYEQMKVSVVFPDD
jgi:hypothetical protein